MRIPESELIINDDGSAFHIHLRPEELSDNVILVGDPGRVDMVCDCFDEVECRHASREFVSATGYRNGKRLTVLSHGICPDNIDIVMTELYALANVDFATREVKPEHRTLNILRIGTSGALHADIPLGAYVLSHISVGFDGVLVLWPCYTLRQIHSSDPTESTPPEDTLAVEIQWNHRWIRYLPPPPAHHPLACTYTQREDRSPSSSDHSNSK